jgi:hypothetical protein
MKLLAWRSLSAGCLIAVLGACTGAAAPSSVHTSPVRTSPVPVAVGAPSAASAASAAQAAATPSALAVVTAYYHAVVRRDYQRAFGYLAHGATGPDGHKLTLRTFLQLARELEGEGGPVTRFSVGVFPSGVVMTLNRVRYGPYHAHLRMTRNRHGWAIGSIDRI